MKHTATLLTLLATAAAQAGPNPVYSSPRVTRETAGHAVDISVDLNGAPKLFLVVRDGGDGIGADWVDWVNPIITGDFGEKKLTEMKPVSAASGWGKVNTNRNAAGQPLVVNGQPVAEGIGTHSTSVIEFDLPPGTRRFTAKGALDIGGAGQGGGATVKFEVYTEKPEIARKDKDGGLDPKEALAALEVADGLQVETFAAEPDLLSPSSIDVDSKGRVWVAEIVNYRGHNGKRPSGDRILVLEDTDRDGKADKTHVFYEGKDIISPHGITVLGPRVIVAAAGKVFNLYDDNGDLRADRTEVMFTGIDGAQHDHSVHAFHFGPDGKLYFNFGNEGHRLKDKDGKLVVDVTGRQIEEKQGGYQQGMIFRCDMDGSNVETLAWNFRNNWEMAVDSFGGIWQSDNDDDGNKGVRINFVLDYGNYGYRDELTSAGWSKGNAKTDADVQIAHWHLTDPGVVPNLLHTGAGSPTGIVVYEGDLLPEKYRGQMIHCDAGPNIVRAYPVKPAGAGYSAETADMVEGKRDRWFRPSDVCVAPDGSLFVSDWYDPGVGGHAMGDLDRGRIYRLTPKGHRGYRVPAFDVSSAAGAIKALMNPNEEVRYFAWTALAKLGESMVPAIREARDGITDMRHLARLAWVAGKVPGLGERVIERTMQHENEDIRCMGLRLARQLPGDAADVAATLTGDSSAAVRREAALCLRFSKSPAMPATWAKLAQRHTSGDRWSVEALGIAAAFRWDECLAEYLKLAPEAANTPAGREILWRSRAKQSAALLAQIIKRPDTTEADKDRCMRALDFQPQPERDKALETLLQ